MKKYQESTAHVFLKHTFVGPKKSKNTGKMTDSKISKPGRHIRKIMNELIRTLEYDGTEISIKDIIMKYCAVYQRVVKRLFIIKC